MATTIEKLKEKNKELIQLLKMHVEKKILNPVRIKTFLDYFIYFLLKAFIKDMQIVLLTIYFIHFLVGAMHLNIKAS